MACNLQRERKNVNIYFDRLPKEKATTYHPGNKPWGKKPLMANFRKISQCFRALAKRVGDRHGACQPQEEEFSIAAGALHFRSWNTDRALGSK